ncbi:MAG: LysM peptidoglycan-binding domain-containing protein [Bacteroidetes bacterium]|nr:LysM peptidoglycan-binding domain-containing protein [Fibrella sp.]
MESENQSPNSRPAATSKLPGITLVVLIALIIALLYIGYEGIADNTKGSEELTNVPVDTTDRQANTLASEPELIGPEDVDTSTAPVPVDLSQAPAPPDESVAEASTEPTGKPEGDPAVRTSTEKPTVDKPKTVVEKPKVEKSVAEKAKVEKPVVEKPKVEKPVAVASPADPPAADKPVAEAEPKEPAAPTGTVSTRHTVGAGETFYSIANRYNLKINTLKALNPGVTETDVKSGVTKLNLKVRAVHTVGPGDVLRVVAERYGVSKEAIMRANKKSKDIATRGERLIIPLAEKQ